MIKSKCVYGLEDCVAKLTREHVISLSVLKTVFGDPIRNVVGSERVFGPKKIVDHDPVVKTVCKRCNSELTHVDEAGVELLSCLNSISDPTGRTIPFAEQHLRWLLKTHLNYFQVIRDRETGETYDLHPLLKSSIISGSPLPLDTFRLMTDAWMSIPEFWDAESETRLPLFHYRSIRFRTQRVVMSNFRMKMFDTVILISSNGDSSDLQERFDSVTSEIKRDFGHVFRTMTYSDLEKGTLPLFPIVPLARVRSFILPATA